MMDCHPRPNGPNSEWDTRYTIRARMLSRFGLMVKHGRWDAAKYDAHCQALNAWCLRGWKES